MRHKAMARRRMNEVGCPIWGHAWGPPLSHLAATAAAVRTGCLQVGEERQSAIRTMQTLRGCAAEAWQGSWSESERWAARRGGRARGGQG